MKKLNINFLKRKKNAHKGDFGHVFVLAGSRGLTGAACLCAQGALLSGAGLVTVGIPESQNVIVARKLTEAMTRPLPQTSSGALSVRAFSQIKAFLKRIDVLALGPGLSQHPQTQRLIRRIIKEITLPMVIDADGLNALRGKPGLLKKNTSLKIITPHPGEMARLLGISTKEVQKNRRELAKQVSRRYNMVTVLKGRRTIVSDSSGKIFVNPTGNPGMAKGGSGDVLTGIIAAFLGQGGEPFTAAALAVYVHGLAADMAVKKTGQLSLLASDILNTLPRVLKKISG